MDSTHTPDLHPTRNLGWWWGVLRPMLMRIQSNRTSLVAAGCAFYATLALFPAISMLVSLYGLAFNTSSVEAQLDLVRGLLPPEAFSLIARQVHAVVLRPRGTLGLSLAIGAAITIWSAATGTKSMLVALNLAYDEDERRGILQFQLIGLGMTLAAIVAAVVALAVLVALPVAAGFIGLPSQATWLIHVVSVGITFLFVGLVLAALYRIGPSRRPGREHRTLPGTILATMLWGIVSVMFSLYVGRVASFDATYGSLAAVAGVMLWFWVSAYAVLVGAELNSALELADFRALAGVDPPLSGLAVEQDLERLP